MCICTHTHMYMATLVLQLLRSKNLRVIFYCSLSLQIQIHKEILLALPSTCTQNLSTLHLHLHHLGPSHQIPCLNYCNSLVMSSPLSTLFILPILSPSIFKTVVLLNLKSDFVSPVLSVLHWLPISARVNTKVLTMVSQTLCDLFSITSLTHFLLLFP